MDKLSGLKRTHTCGALNKAAAGETITLMGWVDSRRDHGGLIFLDLRDRYGITQIMIDPRHDAVYQKGKELRPEFVVSVTGTVNARPEGMVNTNRVTGEIEVEATEIRILNEAETPPFQIVDGVDASEETRLRYRYLDLRRPEMQKNMMQRHALYQLTRNFFSEQDFVEIETPYLMKSTPEGARDYLVPSRNYKGRFYALPQSPQTYKQLLMVSGFDRYFQIVRCFRDEDLRADRQPEFTQIDIEMSFVDTEDIFRIMENFMKEVFKKFWDTDLQMPIPRMSYQEAIERYGSDKPDTRFAMELQTVNDLVADCKFKVFNSTVQNGDSVVAMKLDGGAKYSRKQMDNLNKYIQEIGGKGVVQIKVGENGWDSSLAKFFDDNQIQALNTALFATAGDLLFFIADTWDKAHELMGSLRVKLAHDENLIHENTHHLLWVVDFPMLEYSEDQNRYIARHHPFTRPKDEDLELLETAPEKVRAYAYDLVLDGYEVAGGSLRIYTRELQQKIFELLNISKEEAEVKFGFLMKAFQYGAPPHGGIAFGLDRLAMILANRQSLRDVIAFPKTTSALSLMDNAPADVDPAQLKELGINLTVSNNKI